MSLPLEACSVNVAGETEVRSLHPDEPVDLIYHVLHEEHCCVVQYASNGMYSGGLNHVSLRKEMDNKTADRRNNLTARYCVGLTAIPDGVGLTCLPMFQNKHSTMRGNINLMTVAEVASHDVGKPGKVAADATQIAYVLWKSWILVVNNIKCKLECYTEDFDFIGDISVNIVPKGIHVLAEPYILISGKEAVAKFELDKDLFHDKLSFIWKCTGLPSPTGMTSDPAGFIYVGNYDPFRIDILSQNGKFV